MSSGQDGRYSADRIQQGQDLANKMWNASRLILLNTTAAREQAAAPATEGTELGSPQRVEDRWMVSRLQRAIEAVTVDLDSYDFAHAALELYRFFWSELCDWYLEIVKPRLYDGEAEAATTLLWVLEQTLPCPPVMPFVTEEIYSYLRRRSASRAPRCSSSIRSPERWRPYRSDRGAEVEASIELTRSVGAGATWSESPPGACCPARSPARTANRPTSWSRGWPACPSTAPRARHWRTSAGLRSCPPRR
jgi:valyl-tRNA synthetase